MNDLIDDYDNEKHCSSRPRQEDFRFRYAPVAGTGDAILVSYLRDGDGVRAGKEMIIEAMRSFWLPFAYQAQNYSEAQLRQAALHCCRALEAQIFFIRESFGLPPHGVLSSYSVAPPTPLEVSTPSNHTTPQPPNLPASQNSAPECAAFVPQNASQNR